MALILRLFVGIGSDKVLTVLLQLLHLPGGQLSHLSHAACSQNITIEITAGVFLYALWRCLERLMNMRNGWCVVDGQQNTVVAEFDVCRLTLSSLQSGGIAFRCVADAC